MPQIYFNGPEGRIEGRYAKATSPNVPIALVLHPHPLYEGNMNNKVVYNAYKILADNGYTVLRINFRGEGDRKVNLIMESVKLLMLGQLSTGYSRITQMLSPT